METAEGFQSDSGTRGRGKGLSHDVLGSFVSGYPPEFPLEARGLREVYDIQVFSLLGSQATGLANAEYDLTVVSLANKDARATKLPNLDTDPSRLVNKYLDSVADHKVRHRPTSNLPFHPIIFSLGGMMNGSTTKVFASWKRVMTRGTHNLMLKRVEPLPFAGEGPQL
ncbi:hypothetical protein JCM24511_07352 [Saitozyma sp. JCM 24511]|nr:hypothetical protein JCM24511_07352 [Saitozyma sp. JCM 24511]